MTLVRSLRALRALARVEWRELRRQRSRSVLVLLLVAVPVAAMVGGSALVVTTQPTPEERRAAVLGAADLRVELGHHDDLPRILAALPQTARSAPLIAVPARASRGERRMRTGLVGLPAEALAPGGLATGLLHVSAGRAPRDPGEVALSPALLTALAAAHGDPVTLDTGAPTPMTATVTGTVLDPEDLRRSLVLAPASALDFVPRAVLVTAHEPGLARRLRAAGHHVVTRDELGAADGFEALALFVLGGFAFFEALLVIGAAFAVGLRRRQREIGLMGSCGAGARTITGALLVSTGSLAVAGVALGCGVGLAAAHASQPWLDTFTGRLCGPLQTSTAHLLGAGVLGLITALAAVILPARTTTRLPVRVALGGRRPGSGPSHRALGAGLALIGVGVAALAWGAAGHGATGAVAILAGAVLALLGFGAVSPWILAALARRAAPLPLPWRLAVRDGGRFRARHGPVVTAVMAGMALSILLGALHTSIRAMSVDVGVEQPPRSLIDVALVLTVVTGLVIVFVALALSDAESSADARALHVVGASPRLAARHVASRAAYLAMLGGALAVPAGLIPLLGLLPLADVPLPFVMPWLEVAAAVVALPALAYGLAHLHTSLRTRTGAAPWSATPHPPS